MFSTFYNESIRKLVIGFGSLFNNLNVRHFDSSGSVLKTIRLPISYSPKEKFIARLNEGGSIIEDKAKVKAILPRLGFEITGVNYDSTRTINKLKRQRTVSSSGFTAGTMFNEVPYNISFGLYAFTSTIDENLQVIEQILPFFSPEFIVTVNMNNLHQKVDIPITLSNLNIQEEYEGSFYERRFIVTTFEFLAKSYVYGPTDTQKIITGISGDFYNSLEATLDNAAQVVTSFGLTGDPVTGISGPIYTPAQGRT